MHKPSNVKYKIREMQKSRSAELHEIVLDVAQCCRVFSARHFSYVPVFLCVSDPVTKMVSV
jgi:hypothetical protein